MIDVLKTIKYLYPSLHATVWQAPKTTFPVGYGANGEIDLNLIIYDDSETRRVTLEEILAADQTIINAPTWQESRIAAYLEKGWDDQWGFANDLMIRGFDVVMQDRKTIQTKFPKI